MITAIIQARLNSKRFPSKVFADLGGKPMLQHVIERVKEVKSLDQIVVATCFGGGGAIKVFCDKMRLPCYIHGGNENDVLGRFVACYKSIKVACRPKENPYVILRVCADNPLFDAQSADALIAECIEQKADYCGYETQPGTPAITVPNGYFGEAFTLDAMERLDRFLSPDASEREHVTQGFYRNPQKFKCYWLKVPSWYRKEKLKNAAVDTPEDLKRVRESMEVTA